MSLSDETVLQFPGSWYPLCRSADIKRGQVIAAEFFGKKIAVFRTKSNAIGALDARCCHIGADLSRGWVNGESLTCPLHNWSYGVKGDCTDIPCLESVSTHFRQPTFHCNEQYGLVYAYWGHEPDFPLPTFPGVKRSIFSIPGTIDIDVPYQIGAANFFDEQRLETVHRRQIINGQTSSSKSLFHFGIEYRALVEPRTLYDKLLYGVGRKEIYVSLDYWGGNVLLISHYDSAIKTVVSFLPLDNNRTRVFISTLLPQENNLLSVPFKWLAVKFLNKSAVTFVHRDVSALVGIDFKFMNILPGVDTSLVKWYRYWTRLPRETMGRIKKETPSLIKNIARDKCDELTLVE